MKNKVIVTMNNGVYKASLSGKNIPEIIDFFSHISEIYDFANWASETYKTRFNVEFIIKER